MSTLSDLANEVQKAVYGKDLRRTVANFFEYVPRARSGSYGSLAQYISSIRTAALYKGQDGVQNSIGSAVAAIGTALSNQTIINQSLTIGSAAIGKPTKTAIVNAVNLIVSAVEGSTFSISISGSNYTSDNTMQTISSGSRYINHLTASSGWKFQSVSVTMGGFLVPTTVTDGAATIDISSVNGNITITVTTVQDQPGPGPTPSGEFETFTASATGSTSITISREKAWTPLRLVIERVSGDASDHDYRILKKFDGQPDVQLPVEHDIETVADHVRLGSPNYILFTVSSTRVVVNLVVYEEVGGPYGPLHFNGTYTITLYENNS